MKLTQKTIAKWLVVVAIVLVLLLVLQQPSQCGEGFQTAAAAAAKGAKKAESGIVEVPILSNDLEKQTVTLPIPQGVDKKSLTKVYFKLWDPKKKAWVDPPSNFDKKFDESDTTIMISNGTTRLRKPGSKKGLLKTHKVLPVPVKDMDKEKGLTIKGLNTSNFGILPATGDSSGAKVAVGLVFE